MWEICWMSEQYFSKRCNGCDKIIIEMCWMRENCVTDVLNKGKLIKRCTACGENYNRCTEFEKII